MKTILYTLYFVLLTQFSFSQYFVPFGADSLWVLDNDSTYKSLVYDFEVIDNKLYVLGGQFHYGGTTSLYNTAYYDTSGWHSLNNGNYPAYSIGGNDIINYHDTIYFATTLGGGTGAGGDPNTLYLSGWDGTQWISNPEILNGPVYSLTVCNGLLFFGGVFNQIGGVSYNKIAAFDGTNFINVGSLPATCLSLATFNGEVYAAGTFGVKKYVGGTGYEAWQPILGSNSELMVDTFNNFLYFSATEIVDTLHTNGVAIYDGFTFTNMGGTGTETANVVKIAEYRGVYYGIDGVGGYLVKWDDSLKTWIHNPIGLKMNVGNLIVYDDMLYLAGGGYTGYWGCMDSTDYGIARYFIPPDSASTCARLKPRIQSHVDTFFVNQAVQIHNNNAYIDSWSWDFGDGGTATVQNPFHTYTDTGTYTVSLEVNWQSCQKTIQRNFVVVEDTTNSIKQINKESGFKLYPNPTKSLLFVDIKDEKLKIKNETVQIIDINGKTVKQSVIANAVKQSVSNNEINFVEGFAVATASPRNEVQTIDISHLKKGVYFVKIGEEVQRFVKE